MAEETTESQQSAVEPNGETQAPEVDWKAKYEDAISHSREWEKRAKANKTAADELEQLKQSQMSDAEKAAARTAKLEKELNALKAEKQSTAWRSQVAEETGLPASLIVGDSLEAMQEHAKAISEYVASLQPKSKLPYVPNAGVQPQAASDSSGDWLRDVLQNK